MVINGLLHERFMWRKSPDDMDSNIDFIIEIKDDDLKSYLERQQLLQYLLQLDKSQQVTLAHTRDTVRPKEDCYKGHTDIVKLLLEKNPNVDLCNKDGWSPLNTASDKGHTDIVKLLLEKNPNVDLCSKDGFTPLISFAFNGNLEITQLLLENNADCNTCSHSKQSIIDKLNNHPSRTLDEEKKKLFDILVKNTSSHVTDLVTSYMGRTDVVNCFLDHNANINMTKEDGTTLLFYACEVGHEDIVRLLLDKGADTQICRLDGKSPLKIATDNGHKSIVMMVTNHTKQEDKHSS
ncbi:unnamed protein product [Mytilus coruscus]|uniref:Uncharacterized protein n=1 Tax=Mytilus coruscus TaxID=42192 RepID=A0A6J8BA94_MYTCO|nr:unnamed protein product [Mytilus coruscus]